MWVSVIPPALVGIGINASEVFSWVLQLSFTITKGNLIRPWRQGLEEVHFASQHWDLGSPEVAQKSNGWQGPAEYPKIQETDYPAACCQAKELESEQCTIPPGLYS